MESLRQLSIENTKLRQELEELKIKYNDLRMENAKLKLKVVLLEDGEYNNLK